MIALANPIVREAEDRLRLVVLESVVGSLGPEDQSRFRGFRNPFGFRHYGQIQISAETSARLIRAVSPLARSGEPLSRGIYSDLVEQADVVESKEVTKLRLLIEMRGRSNRWSALGDERSLLLCCRDRLRLAELTSDAAMRRDALRELVDLVQRPTCSTAAAVLIARDLENCGSSELRPGRKASASELWLSQRIAAGDFRSVLAEAASEALSSPDLSVANLGGRSGVITVSDYFNVVGGTFVFKATTVLSWKRELRRSEALRESLHDAGLADRFGVVDHLSPGWDEMADMSDTASVNTVRRFAYGQVLSDYALTLPIERRVNAVSLAATYLGYIHALEHAAAGLAVGVRKDVKVKEVGRWLKRIGLEDPLSVFDRYWACYGDLPMYRRRDAHPLNWLVVSEDRLLAVDLEATGWRPMTYEVAQLTEDSCLLPPKDWDSRLAVLNAYMEACGQTLSPRVIEAFEASVAARSLRKLTPPTGFGSVLQDGQEVLAISPSGLRATQFDPSREKWQWRGSGNAVYQMWLSV